MRELASWLHSELQVTRRPPGPVLSLRTAGGRGG